MYFSYNWYVTKNYYFDTKAITLINDIHVFLKLFNYLYIFLYFLSHLFNIANFTFTLFCKSMLGGILNVFFFVYYVYFIITYYFVNRKAFTLITYIHNFERVIEGILV